MFGTLFQVASDLVTIPLFTAVDVVTLGCELQEPIRCIRLRICERGTACHHFS